MVRVQVTFATKADRERVVDIAQKTLGAGKAVAEYFDGENYTVYVTEGAFLAVMQNIDSADILDIAVLPEQREQGRASALLQFMFDDLTKKGVTEIFLEVRASNAGAIALYEKHGFKKISVRKNYYSNPVEDALIYRREI